MLTSFQFAKKINSLVSGLHESSLVIIDEKINLGFAGLPKEKFGTSIGCLQIIKKTGDKFKVIENIINPDNDNQNFGDNFKWENNILTISTFNDRLKVILNYSYEYIENTSSFVLINDS